MPNPDYNGYLNNVKKLKKQEFTDDSRNLLEERKEKRLQEQNAGLQQNAGPVEKQADAPVDMSDWVIAADFKEDVRISMPGGEKAEYMFYRKSDPRTVTEKEIRRRNKAVQQRMKKSPELAKDMQKTVGEAGDVVTSLEVLNKLKFQLPQGALDTEKLNQNKHKIRRIAGIHRMAFERYYRNKYGE
nr:hypothetical protein [Lachnospiraceae bacterium]